MATTKAENKELVRRFENEVWNEGNLDSIEEYLAEDFVEHSPLPQAANSRAEYIEEAKAYQTAIPDVTYTVEDVVAEGDKVGTRVTVEGTHEGELLGVEPTGKSVEFDGMAIFRIEDGKISDLWVQGDFMGLLEQLGVA